MSDEAAGRFYRGQLGWLTRSRRRSMVALVAVLRFDVLPFQAPMHSEQFSSGIKSSMTESSSLDSLLGLFWTLILALFFIHHHIASSIVSSRLHASQYCKVQM